MSFSFTMDDDGLVTGTRQRTTVEGVDTTTLTYQLPFTDGAQGPNHPARRLTGARARPSSAMTFRRAASLE
jgi:hypothetical protein